MAITVSPQLLSVVIPTHNREGLLRLSLESLVLQTLDPQHFEVVVVDDGSSDGTAALCRELSARLPLRYFRLQHAGISAAKNLGVFAAQGSIILFFDDDDVAHPELCAEHLKFHQRHPELNVAALGLTEWAPGLTVTPVMRYVMDVGQLLFAYRSLTHGQTLDFSYFWGGRSSCKRLLLVKHGVFNQWFGRIIEDIELGYRLSRIGLTVIFNRHARQFMNRPLTYEDFCRRCEAQGAAYWKFSRLHADAAAQRYCRVEGARDKWDEMARRLPAKVRRVAELQRLAHRQSRLRKPLEKELFGLYAWTFEAFRAKGVVSAIDAEIAGTASTRPERKRA